MCHVRRSCSVVEALSLTEVKNKNYFLKCSRRREFFSYLGIVLFKTNKVIYVRRIRLLELKTKHIFLI